jgi:cyclopropane fatty-acyl-phospholipid synthase-like methyltransferase
MIVIVVCHNQLNYTKQFVESVGKAADNLDGVKIVMVNNASDKDTAEYLFGLKAPFVYHENNENKFFTIANKEIIDMYPDEDIYLVNNDVIVLDRWLSGIKSLKNWGAIGATQLHPVETDFVTFGGGGVDFAGHKAYWKWVEADYERVHEERWLTGCGMMINRKAYDSVGGFDTDLKFYCQDSDLSLRLQSAGFKVGVSKDMRIIHFGGLTTRAMGQGNPMQVQGMKDQQLFAMKHKVKCGQFDYREVGSDYFDKDYFETYGNKNLLSNYFVKQDKESLVVAGRWINETGMSKGDKVLEIGCAYGQVVKKLRDLGVSAFGVDVSKYSIERGKKEVTEFIETLDITKCDFVDAIRKRFGVDKFDYICSAITFEHFKPEQLGQVFLNLAELSKAGTYHFHEIDLIQGNDETHFSIFPREQWNTYFKYNGFELIEPNSKDKRFNWFRFKFRDMTKVKEFYDDYFNNEGMFIKNKEVSKIVAEEVFNTFALKDKKVLELGCAFGQVVKGLQTLGAEAYGFDISETAINKGSVKDCKAHDFTQGFNGMYHLIFSKAVLEHIPESKVDGLIKNIYECTAKDGITHHEIDTEKGVDPSHVTIHGMEWWIDKFQKAGFKQVSANLAHTGIYNLQGVK